MTFAWTDMFCGAGGSSTGLIAVPGFEVATAANHWQTALDIHNANHPNTDHAHVDLHQEDPAFFRRTEGAWFSPACTKWSQAGGAKNRPAIEEGLFADPHADDVATRSRLLMFDVLRFVEHHQYDVIVVENVVDIAVQSKYALAWQVWRRDLTNLGYKHRVVSLNSMHAQYAGLPAPQSRDRLYVVAWRIGVPTPDLDRILQPKAWCPRCERIGYSRQAFRNGREAGRYRQAYDYVHDGCGALVEPGWLPAYTALDLSDLGTLIGERPKPIAEKTRARVAAGIARYWFSPFITQVAGHTFERRPGVRTWPAMDPMGTIDTTNGRALAIPMEGRDGKHAAPLWEPMRTQTTRNETGLLVPSGGTWNEDARPISDTMRTLTTRDAYAVARLPFIAELRGGGSDARTVAEPAATFVASGNHHALVTQPLLMRNFTARGDEGQMSTPVTEWMRTITTSANQSLIQHAGHRKPAPHVGEDAIRAAEKYVDECYLRMLKTSEAAAGMAFPDTYEWQPDQAVKISDRNLVKAIGNAVTPPASRDIGYAIAESLAA